MCVCVHMCVCICVLVFVGGWFQQNFANSSTYVHDSLITYPRYGPLFIVSSFNAQEL